MKLLPSSFRIRKKTPENSSGFIAIWREIGAVLLDTRIANWHYGRDEILVSWRR
ncbi:MAG: hypothetical protein WAM75_08045 [Xanthobacteraceae bacterium]